MEYTTLANLKSFLGITDNSKDAELQKMITLGSDLLDMEFGQNLAYTTKSRYVDGTGTNRIVMERKIENVEYVKVRINMQWIPYTVDRTSGCIIYCFDSIPKGLQNVEVRYSVGMNEVPSDLENFFLLYCKVLIENNDSETASNQSSKEIKRKQLESLSIEYFGPGELASGPFGKKNSSFAIDYDRILKKYKNFRLYVA